MTSSLSRRAVISVPPVAVALIALGGLTGCSADSTAQGDWSATRASGPQAPTAVTGVRLTIADDKINGNDGCNTFFGPVSLDDQVLKVGTLGSTLIGCVAQTASTAAWVTSVLQASPGCRVSGDELTLTCADGRTLVLSRSSRNVTTPS